MGAVGAVVVEEVGLAEAVVVVVVSVDVLDKRTTPEGEEGVAVVSQGLLLLLPERSGEGERERLLRSVPAEIWR